MMFEVLMALQQLPTVGADYGPPLEAHFEQTFDCGDVEYAIGFRKSEVGLVVLGNVTINGEPASPDARQVLSERLRRYRSLFSFSAACDLKGKAVRLIWSGFLDDESSDDPEGGVSFVAFISRHGEVRID